MSATRTGKFLVTFGIGVICLCHNSPDSILIPSTRHRTNPTNTTSIQTLFERMSTDWSSARVFGIGLICLVAMVPTLS